MPQASTVPTSVFVRDGEVWLPTALARGPWDERAQHGGAPSALLVHIAENSVDGDGWALTRLTVELIKPVPLTPLTVSVQTHPGRSTTRTTIDLFAGDAVVARGHALLMRGQAFELPTGVPGWSPAALHPQPDECSGPLMLPGTPQGVSFFQTAMEHRMSQGDTTQPGPAAAWFRLNVPLVHGQSTSAAMRAVAAADFGNGVSWVLRADQYLFTNPDLSVHLHRPAVGEWIGVQAETQVDRAGAGTAVSKLYDQDGPIGVATQSLLVRKRR